MEKQFEIYKNKYPYKIIQGIRQSGKTKLLIDTAIDRALNESNVNIAFVSPTLHMSDFIKTELKNRFYNVPHILCVFNKDKIVFTNGSTIYFGNIGPSLITKFKGIRMDMTLIDELAFADNNHALEFLQNNFSKEIVIASTRKNRSKKNIFWNIWLHAIEGEPWMRGRVFKPFTVTLKDCPHVKNIAKDAKRNMPRSQYDLEFTIRKK